MNSATIKEQNFIRDGRAPIPSNVAISKVMSANKAKNSIPELTLRHALWNNGIKGYRLHSRIPGRPDIAYVSKKIAIFVNGCYWHRCPYCKPHFPHTNKLFWRNKFKANIERDKRVNIELKQLEWKVITIWECQIKNNLKQQVDTVHKAYHE